jgi:hypothetical protein
MIPGLLVAAPRNVKTGVGPEPSPLLQTYGEKAADEQATAQLTLNGAPPSCAAYPPRSRDAACAHKQLQAE